MESLPLMLQAALRLLGYALSNYLFTINNVVAGGVVGVTAFGVLFYLLICSAVTLSYNRPSQFPVSFAIRSMVRSDDEHRKYPRRVPQENQKLVRTHVHVLQEKARAEAKVCGTQRFREFGHVRCERDWWTHRVDNGWC
jgi:hypothetical protein